MLHPLYLKLRVISANFGLSKVKNCSHICCNGLTTSSQPRKVKIAAGCNGRKKVLLKSATSHRVSPTCISQQLSFEHALKTSRD